MAHDHYYIDDCFAAYADAARQGRIARFQLEEGIRRLRHHFWVEEEFVFPAMAHANPGPVMVMLREHGVIWDLVDELEELHADGDPDPLMAVTLYEALEQQMEKHNFTEDNVLYAVTDDVLDEELARPVLHALAREMPTGWRCAMATARV